MVSPFDRLSGAMHLVRVSEPRAGNRPATPIAAGARFLTWSYNAHTREALERDAKAGLAVYDDRREVRDKQ